MKFIGRLKGGVKALLEKKSVITMLNAALIGGMAVGIVLGVAKGSVLVSEAILVGASLLASLVIWEVGWVIWWAITHKREGDHLVLVVA